MTDELKPLRRTVCRILAPVYLMLIFGLPTLALAASWDHAPHLWVAFFSPFLFTGLFVTTAGCLSLPHRKAIVEGKFPRDLAHPIYFHRRLYGLCWTSVYYFKPVYYLCLSVPLLKAFTFRIFGYRGQMDFTIYPDTWIRDLPLLDFGEGAYIANRATLGTNLALSNGTTMVGPIKIGKDATIGHLVAIAPGCVFEEGVEIGSVVAIGYKSTFEANSSVQPRCSIEHGVRIGKNCYLGATTYIGTSSRVADDARIDPGTVVKPRSRVGK